MKTLLHKWASGLLKRHPEWVCCSVCGIIKNAQGENGPCRGVVRVTLRDTDHDGYVAGPGLAPRGSL